MLVQYNVDTFEYVCKMSNHTDEQFLINLSLSVLFILFSFLEVPSRRCRRCFSALLLYFCIFISIVRFTILNRTLRRHSKNSHNNGGTKKLNLSRMKWCCCVLFFSSKSTEHIKTKGSRVLWCPTD